jgi:hypothetical protein
VETRSLRYRPVCSGRTLYLREAEGSGLRDCVKCFGAAGRMMNEVRVC